MRRLVAWLEQTQNWITFALIWLLTITVSLQVLIRYVIRQPLLLWSVEMARFALIWLAFLGIGVGVKNGTHFAMDILVRMLDRRRGAILHLFSDLCTAVIFILLTLGGIRFAGFGLTELSTAMEIPMVWIYASVPVGGFLALVYLADRIHQHIRDLQGADE